MNNAIGQNKKRKLTYPLVGENGENISSTEKVANKFCKYFTNIGPNLVDKIAPASKSFQDFINSVPSESLSSFNHVTAKELKSIAKGFKEGKAPGTDNIPISIIEKTLGVESGYRGLKGITNSHRRLQEVFRDFRGLERVTGDYNGVKRLTTGSKGCRGVMMGYK